MRDVGKGRDRGRGLEGGLASQAPPLSRRRSAAARDWPARTGKTLPDGKVPCLLLEQLVSKARRDFPQPRALDAPCADPSGCQAQLELKAPAVGGACLLASGWQGSEVDGFPLRLAWGVWTLHWELLPPPPLRLSRLLLLLLLLVLLLRGEMGLAGGLGLILSLWLAAGPWLVDSGKWIPGWRDLRGARTCGCRCEAQRALAAVIPSFSWRPF